MKKRLKRNNYIEAVAKAIMSDLKDLRKLVGKMAVQSGLAKPVEKTQGDTE